MDRRNKNRGESKEKEACVVKDYMHREGGGQGGEEQGEGGEGQGGGGEGGSRLSHVIPEDGRHQPPAWC